MKKFFITIIFLLCFTSFANALDIGFEWDANDKENGVFAYILYYGSEPNVCGKDFKYISIHDLEDKKNPAYTLKDLDSGVYYFTLSAENHIGISDCTYEISNDLNSNVPSGFIKIIVNEVIK